MTLPFVIAISSPAFGGGGALPPEAIPSNDVIARSRAAATWQSPRMQEDCSPALAAQVQVSLPSVARNDIGLQNARGDTIPCHCDIVPGFWGRRHSPARSNPLAWCHCEEPRSGDVAIPSHWETAPFLAVTLVIGIIPRTNLSIRDSCCLPDQSSSFVNRL
jgi:hypothetical protein